MSINQMLKKVQSTPNGWIQLTLGDVGHWFGGGTPSKANPHFWNGGSIPWVSPKDMKVDLVTDAQDHITEDAVAQSSTNLVEAGSVLVVARSGILQHTLPVAVTQRQVALNQDLKAVKPFEYIRPGYLALALKASEREILHTCTKTGTTVQSLEMPAFLRFQIPIAPLSEQDRIVAEVEKQFTRLDAGIAALRRTQTNLKHYRAAVLKAACEGSLIPTETERWKGGTLGDVIISIDSGKSFRCDERPPTKSETGVAKVSAVTWGTYNELESKTCLDPEKIEERYLIQPGDFLFSRANTIELVGACVITQNITLRVMLSDKLLRFRFAASVLPSWVLYWLRSDFGRHEIERLATGNQESMRNIGQKRIRQIKFKVPPLAEQTQILAEVERRLSVVDELESAVKANLQRATCLRQTILQRAFAGNLVPQNPSDEPTERMLERVRNQQQQIEKSRSKNRGRKPPPKEPEVSAMKTSQDPKLALKTALSYKPEALTTEDLFRAGNFERAQAYAFYDAIADSPEAIERLSVGHYAGKAKPRARRKPQAAKAPLRLHELWVKKFKNLEDYLVTFDPQHALDVLLGWNGTGKSNLFEVLIAIFRDLHKWQTKDKWTPQEGLDGYRIRYEIGGRLVEIKWDVDLRRPVATVSKQHQNKVTELDFEKCKREEIPLPHFVFGYYSGPSNRFAELFSEPKQDHYDRLLKEKTDDEVTLTRLLEQRRFFNAETHHAKYALLSFFYQNDPAIRSFLKKNLRIEGLESVLFVLKRPRWHRNNNPKDFWGADGLLRPVLERLRRHSIGQMVLPQSVDDGFQDSTRDHFFLFLPTQKHLQGLASEYTDPTSFFVALESTDFSSIIHDVRIRVRINATASKQTVITFKEMSEGEQQLLMVLGLLRFTKMSQSLVLLDEPDTHLNPHWQLGYLHLLLEALVGTDASPKVPRLPIEELEKRLTSQVLLSTHDPLAIAGLVKENIHLLKRRDKTEECLAIAPTESPRGMGFTGILTSEMFGLKSDLDEETLSLLDQHAELIGMKSLTTGQKKKLRKMTDEVERLGFKSTSSDPYYRAFLQALARRRNARDLLKKATWTKEDIKSLGKETDEILEEIENEDDKK